MPKPAIRDKALDIVETLFIQNVQDQDAIVSSLAEGLKHKMDKVKLACLEGIIHVSKAKTFNVVVPHIRSICALAGHN